MAEFKGKINGINIFEYDAPKWRGHEKCSGLISDGVVYRLYRFLTYYGLIDEYETIDSVWNNVAAREGNEYQLLDNYRFCWDDEYENLEISYLYVVNGMLWGVLYNKANDSWYGDFEIPCNI